MKIKQKYRLYQSEVIEQFINIHGDRYNYTKVNYINDNTKVTIICSIHGEFEQTPSNHKRGQNCPKCNNRKLSLNDIKYKLSEKHNSFYIYTEFNELVKSSEKIKIICPIHGEFEQTLNNHMRGQGCKKCKGLEKPELNILIEKFNKVHNNKYIYDNINYLSAHKKIKIICPMHGEFEQTPNNHKNGNGCPICNESNGEKKIRNFLSEHNIIFNPQHKFSDCKNILKLPFDFYLQELNICIEFNGIQHYKPIKHFGGKEGLNKRKINDKIKMEYCLNNNIPLIIVKYNDNIIKTLLKSGKLTVNK